MTGTIRVNPESLLSASGELNNCSAVIGGLTQQMVSMVDGLNSVWMGEAAAAYHKKFHQLDTDIQHLMKMIRDHAGELQEMARSYQTAEQQAREISFALPTDPIG